jgi:hypothetical protein
MGLREDMAERDWRLFNMFRFERSPVKLAAHHNRPSIAFARFIIKCDIAFPGA